ncbi:MAG: hypothetical protein GF330_07000 [Candidatus Eisenbacteria bacterium]|nr:hypothetical protein [Candidatus Eisenbacteria bacterium]
MRSARLPLVLLFLTAVACSSLAPTRADPGDLSNGVLITHHPPLIEFTNPPPVEGWCDVYQDGFQIHCCSEQNARIDLDPGEGTVWFILAAWEEEKEFCGIDFGFGDYEADLFLFDDFFVCPPEGTGALQWPTPGWPGPNEGVMVTRTGSIGWQGNFVPIYHFTGYAYGAGIIPLARDPQTGDAAFCNCIEPYELFDIECLGGMGIATDGIECCPEGGPSRAAASSWGTIKRLYR